MCDPITRSLGTKPEVRRHGADSRFGPPSRSAAPRVAT